MKNESGLVHFTIGAGFGITLANLAHEALIYEMNPVKAVNVYKESLIGITDELVYTLLNNENVVIVDVADQTCGIVKRDESHTEYPEVINFIEYINHKTKQLITDIYEIRPVFKRLIYSINDMQHIDIDIPYSSIIKFINDGNKNYDELVNKYIDFEEEFGELESLIKIYKDTMLYGLNFINLCKFLDKCYSLGIYNSTTEEGMNLNADLDCLFNYISSMQGDLIGYCNDDFQEELKHDELKNYFKAMKENDKILSNEIQPVNIFDRYDAGWLSPDGKFYGLNGHIANMLHITIAEALQRIGVIPETENNPSGWLDENGWVKIHTNNINFGSYAHSKIFNNVPKYMTEKQIKIVYEYGQKLYDGGLKIGFLLQPMSAVRFEMLANADSERLYELF